MPDLVKKPQIDFGSVIERMRAEGSAQGFRQLRDFFLKNYHSLKGEFSPLGLMNLIISFDKHAIFADLSDSKTKEKDNQIWKMFQGYMMGKVESFSLPEEASDDELSVDEPAEGSDQDGASAEPD